MTTRCGETYCKDCSADVRICTEMIAIEMYIKMRDGKYPLPPAMRD